ncbi:MAG: LysE family transporter [Planctomycetota bacterium]|nr:LysE family transporter [Planctomycetota bacterium]
MDVAIFSIYFLQGLLLGLQAGFSPGPFTTLVISESLAHGRGAGLKCSLAPLISDPPVVLLSLTVLDQVSSTDAILGITSLLGAAMLCWVAWKCFAVKPEQFEKSNGSASSLWKAVGVNILNPNPYIFWLTIIGPLCLAAARKDGISCAVAFIAAFYVALIGCKMSMAMVAGGARHHLNTRWLVIVNRMLGLAMLAFVVRFAWSGWNMLSG